MYPPHHLKINKLLFTLAAVVFLLLLAGCDPFSKPLYSYEILYLDVFDEEEQWTFTQKGSRQEGETITLPGRSESCCSDKHLPHKIFRGWAADGSDKIYQPGDSYKITGDVTFRAQYFDAWQVVYDVPGLSPYYGASNYNEQIYFKVKAGSIHEVKSYRDIPVSDYYNETYGGFTDWTVITSDSRTDLVTAGDVLTINSDTKIIATYFDVATFAFLYYDGNNLVNFDSSAIYRSSSQESLTPPDSCKPGRWRYVYSGKWYKYPAPPTVMSSSKVSEEAEKIAEYSKATADPNPITGILAGIYKAESAVKNDVIYLEPFFGNHYGSFWWEINIPVTDTSFVIPDDANPSLPTTSDVTVEDYTFLGWCPRDKLTGCNRKEITINYSGSNYTTEAYIGSATSVSPLLHSGDKVLYDKDVTQYYAVWQAK